MFELAKSEEKHVSLAVLIHAFILGPESMKYVEKVVKESKTNVHVVAPKLPLGMFSTADANVLAWRVLQEIESQIQFRAANKWPEFEEIILIGHSFGALIARKVYVLSCGETAEAPFEGHEHMVRRDWAGKVTRLILLAGMNRGWTITHHLNVKKAIQLSLGTVVGHILLSVFKKRLVIFQARRGSAFLTQLRLQWLALAASCRKEGIRMVTTIQLLGTIDDLVSPDDNIDLVTGRDFLYLDVPHSGHTNVIELDDTNAGQSRREVFETALVESEQTIRGRNILPADPILAQIRPDVTNVIFVIHGIRDAGYWTHKIARKVLAMGQAPPRIYASETSKYGYFPMVPFLLPSRRRQKVEWLMDQYVEAKSLYPNATFSYVGHSNGTYLLANAVENYRACRFDHVVFAGSVVRQAYDWLGAIERKQVKAVLNYVATADWVVAWFPGALEELRWQDLGTAGHNGFAQAKFVNGKSVGPVYERRYVRGGHGAALTEENWDDIAYFAVKGQPAGTPAETAAKHRQWLTVGVGWVAPAVWVLLVALVALGGWGIWSALTREWAKTLAIVVYAMGIWRVLTWL